MYITSEKGLKVTFLVGGFHTTFVFLKVFFAWFSGFLNGTLCVEKNKKRRDTMEA